MTRRGGEERKERATSITPDDATRYLEHLRTVMPGEQAIPIDLRRSIRRPRRESSGRLILPIVDEDMMELAPRHQCELVREPILQQSFVQELIQIRRHHHLHTGVEHHRFEEKVELSDPRQIARNPTRTRPAADRVPAREIRLQVLYNDQGLHVTSLLKGWREEPIFSNASLRHYSNKKTLYWRLYRQKCTDFFTLFSRLPTGYSDTSPETADAETRQGPYFSAQTQSLA